VRLVRGATAGSAEISWDPLKALSPEAVSEFDAVVHLAGKSIADRWTQSKKTSIRESRRMGTRNLAEALAHAPQRPRVLLAASAIGYYGDRGDEVLSEQSAAGNDFLATVCREWEAATEPARSAGIRTINCRIGIVLSATGGALAKMLLPFRFGLGGRFGDGTQWWSWIHLNDVIGAFVHAMENASLDGPVNLVAPHPVTNAEFTKVLGSVLRRPTLFPVPAFAARLALGEMADQLLLASQRVTASKLAASGYTFHYPQLRDALEHSVRSDQ
jgi:uncharacterized protein (TIGR01777 family)